MVVSVSVTDEIVTVNKQEKIVSVEVSPDIVVVEKYVGVSLTADSFAVTDDGEGTVYIS